MLLWHIARQHWVFFGISVGLAVVLVFALSYIVMWSDRKIEGQNARIEINSFGSFLFWFQSAFPWVLILTIAGATAVTVGYGILKALEPPNW